MNRTFSPSTFTAALSRTDIPLITMRILQAVLSSFLALALLPSALLAEGRYEAALNKAGRKPVVLFCYGANYDKVSERAYESFIRQRGINRALRGADLVVVPVFQAPDEKQKKEYAKVMGNKKLPDGIWSYPCLAVVDARGNLRGVVQSAEEMKDAEAASAALGIILEQFEEQEKILRQAERATGNRRVALIAEAADIDLQLPPSALKPDARTERRQKSRRSGNDADQAGGNRFNFDPLALVEKIEPMSMVDAHNYVRGLEASGSYSKRQRQEMLAALAGHIRRNKGSKALLRALYTEMRNIDPSSIYGAYAEGAIELWCPDEASASPKP